MDVFLSNFKTLFTIIAKSSSKMEDCPLSYTIMCAAIEWAFQSKHDKDNVLLYKQYVDAVKTECEKEKKNLDKILRDKDRSVFKYASVLPNTLPSEYQKHMSWYIEFLQNRMPQNHMDMVFRYIKTLNNGISNVNT